MWTMLDDKCTVLFGITTFALPLHLSVSIVRYSQVKTQRHRSCGTGAEETEQANIE